MKKKLILFLCILYSVGISAQTIENNPLHLEEHGMNGSQRLTLGLGHSHLSEGEVNGKSEWLVLPSWSLNYDYWLTNKLAIGLQNDIVLESFLIESNEGELIKRNYPLSIVPVILFKSTERISWIAGIGKEIAENESLTFTRLGVEYGFHLPKNWEVSAALVWDGKWEYYNSWGLAFTFSKIRPSKKHKHLE